MKKSVEVAVEVVLSKKEIAAAKRAAKAAEKVETVKEEETPITETVEEVEEKEVETIDEVNINSIIAIQKQYIEHSLLNPREASSETMTVLSISSSWKDGMEARSFEKVLLTVIGDAFNCGVYNVREKGIDTFKVYGQVGDVETVLELFPTVLANVRTETKKLYKNSTKELSLFKFTTTHHIKVVSDLFVEVGNHKFFPDYLEIVARKREMNKQYYDEVLEPKPIKVVEVVKPEVEKVEPTEEIGN